MHRSPVPALSLLLIAGMALPAAAQQFAVGKIQFQGDPEYTNQELLAASGLKKGLLTYDQMNKGAKQLMSTGMFEGLSFTFNGNTLVYKIRPETDLYPILIDNLPLTAEPDLDNKLHAEIPLYHGKVPGEGGLSDTVRATLEKMLAAEGIHAPVKAMPKGDGSSDKTRWIAYSIASPPVRPVIAQLSGVSPGLQASTQELASQVAKGAYSTRSTAQDLENLFAQFYQDRGYAAVKVDAKQAGGPRVTADAILVPFAVTVQEGRTYKLGTVSLPPGVPVKQADIDKILAHRNPGSPIDTRLSNILKAVTSAYESKGYLDCKVASQPSFDEASDTVNYKITADTGAVYHLAFVKFENVTSDLRRKLMMNWQMMPGDPFNEGYASQFLVAAGKQDPDLRKELAGAKEVTRIVADPVTHNVNVVIRLKM